MILSTRRTADGVELTAGIEQPDERPDAKPHPRQDLAAALRFHAVPDAIASRLDANRLAASLSALLHFGPLPLSGTAPPMLLAGTPGAGKTLSAARLATRLVIAGAAPMVITTDAMRAGAAEELAAFTRLLGIELIAASTPSTLARALAGRPAGTPVLIDTQGVNPFLAHELDAIAALADGAAAAIVLVAQAGADTTEAAEQADAFAQAGASHLLPTRLDLARRLGGVLAAATAGDLVLTEAGTGPGATGCLETITPAWVAGRLLKCATANIQPQAATRALPPTHAKEVSRVRTA